jgi:hypothetical protein
MTFRHPVLGVEANVLQYEFNFYKPSDKQFSIPESLQHFIPHNEYKRFFLYWQESMDFFFL